MRRWHQERPLMLKRWAEEKRKHLEDDLRWGGAQDSFEHCHCSAGPGLMRKARPWDRPTRHGVWLHREHLKERDRSRERLPSPKQEGKLRTSGYCSRGHRAHLNIEGGGERRDSDPSRLRSRATCVMKSVRQS